MCIFPLAGFAICTPVTENVTYSVIKHMGYLKMIGELSWLFDGVCRPTRPSSYTLNRRPGMSIKISLIARAMPASSGAQPVLPPDVFWLTHELANLRAGITS